MKDLECLGLEQTEPEKLRIDGMVAADIKRRLEHLAVDWGMSRRYAVGELLALAIAALDKGLLDDL